MGAVTLRVAANTLPGVQGPSVEAPSGAPQGVETGVEGVRVQDYGLQLWENNGKQYGDVHIPHWVSVSNELRKRYDI